MWVTLVSFLAVYCRAVSYGLLVAAGMLYQQLCNPTRMLRSVRRRDAPPSCLQDPSLGQHRYLMANGIKIHYVEKGNRSKPLMLFLHGFPEFWYSWRHQIVEFSKDYWTVAVDMRGYGDSDKPKGVSAYRPQCMVEDIKHIVTELGRETFILVSHDWGSILAWVFVQTYPAMVEKYITMNGPHPAIYLELLRTSARQSKMSWYVYFFQLPYLPELSVRWNDMELISRVLRGNSGSNSSSVSKEDIEAYKYTFSRPGAFTPPMNYYRNILLGEGSHLRVASGVEWPQGLYIFGDEDRAVDKLSIAMQEERIPRLRSVIIKGASHFVQQDDPQAVNEAMRSFLLTN